MAIENLVKLLRLTYKGGAYVGRPFFGVHVCVYQTHNLEWRVDIDANGKTYFLGGHNTRESALNDVVQFGIDLIDYPNGRIQW